MKIITLFLTSTCFMVLINAMEHSKSEYSESETDEAENDGTENEAELVLPTEHYDYIRAGSMLSVMIAGNTYIEKGLLYEKPNNQWDYWVVYNHPSQSATQDSAYISVVDPVLHTPGQTRRRKHFAARLYRHNNVNGYVNPTSQCFVINGLYVYHATLTFRSFTLRGLPSRVYVRAEYNHNGLYVFFGRLTPWIPPHQHYHF
ncbi:uncharacterized protein LOC117180210 [Belonocnema kinseyi]|uniref:uncharacterized protein LOC117180210 n=1 Tax=Belonocnema kinseyi TaxID=2817044 RepID=UPI00143D4266|nr:uncharacterized protein LOC117180210 [Belonocnema kinseyi]